MKRLPVPILYVHWGNEGIRGSERVLLDLLSGIDRKQFAPVLWCNAETLAAAAAPLDIPARVSAMPILLGWDAPRLDVSGYRRLVDDGKSLIREFGVGLVHANSGAPNQWMAPAARQARVPMLAHLHAIYGLRERCTLLLHQVPLIVGCSGAVVAPFARDGVPDSRLRVIYNGVDVERLSHGEARGLRRSRGIPDTAFVVAAAGALVKLKRFDALIRALRITCDQGIDAHLIIAGEGPELASLTELARDLSLEDRVHLLGTVENVGAIFRDAADIVAVSSQIESFGLVAAEASAMARGVVATNVGGLPEVVEDGVTGVLVAPGNEREFAAAFTRLARDPQARIALGAAGQRRVASHFTTDHATKSFEALYSNLLERPRTDFGWSRLGFRLAPFARLGFGVVGRRLGARIADA